MSFSHKATSLTLLTVIVLTAGIPPNIAYAQGLQDAINESQRAGRVNQTPTSTPVLPKIAECKSINDVISQPLSANPNSATVAELIGAKEGQISNLQTLNLQDVQLKSIQVGYVDVLKDALDTFKTALIPDFGQRAAQEPQFAFKLSTLPTRQYELKKQLATYCQDSPATTATKTASITECKSFRIILDRPSARLVGDNPRAIQAAVLSSEEERLNQLQALNLQDSQLKDIQISYLGVLNEIVSAIRTASAPNPAIQAQQELLQQQINEICP
jgi:Leucine-rich repeat (LRR) protein